MHYLTQSHYKARNVITLLSHEIRWIHSGPLEDNVSDGIVFPAANSPFQHRNAADRFEAAGAI
jgi:hypothetical protein